MTIHAVSMSDGASDMSWNEILDTRVDKGTMIQIIIPVLWKAKEEARCSMPRPENLLRWGKAARVAGAFGGAMESVNESETNHFHVIEVDPPKTTEVHDFAPLLDIVASVGGLGNSPPPALHFQMVRIGLLAFTPPEGQVDSAFLGLALQSPPEQLWTVRDVIAINHLFGNDETRSGGNERQEDDVRSDDVWSDDVSSTVLHFSLVSPLRRRCHPEGKVSPFTGSMPFPRFLEEVLSSTRHETFEGLSAKPSDKPHLELDRSTRPSTLVSLVADLSRRARTQVAEHLGATLGPGIQPRQSLGLHDGMGPPSVFHRSEAVCYLATQRCGAVIIDSSMDGDSVGWGQDSHLRNVLPNEFQTATAILYLLVLHQNHRLEAIRKHLANATKAEQSRTDKSGSVTEPDPGELQVLRGLQLELLELRNHFALRQVTFRFGAQKFYELVCEAYQIWLRHEDVGRVIGDLEEYYSTLYAESERGRRVKEEKKREDFESSVTRGGITLAALAIGLTVISLLVEPVDLRPRVVWLILSLIFLVMLSSLLHLVLRHQLKNEKKTSEGSGTPSD